MNDTAPDRPAAGLYPGSLPAKSQWLKAMTSARAGDIGVDREKDAILGCVVAQEGPFKTEDRGAFDMKSLRTIRDQINAEDLGLKSRFMHPHASDDGLGKYLGRMKNARMDKKMVRDEQDDSLFHEVNLVRADLYFDASAHETPHGDLAGYLMKRCESDPDSLSSSLVLMTDEEMQLDEKGRPALDDDGNPLPPLWRPTKLHASDIVDMGDAVDGLLSANTDGLPDAVLRQGVQLLDQQFAGASREAVEARLVAFMERYLDHRYGPKESLTETVPDEQPMLPNRSLPTDKGSDDKGFQIGDLVEFYLTEELDGGIMCVEKECGIVRAIVVNGTLGFPPTDAEFKGTETDPAVLVQCLEDPEATDDYTEEPCWYLLPQSRLQKKQPLDRSFIYNAWADEVEQLELEIDLLAAD